MNRIIHKTKFYNLSIKNNNKTCSIINSCYNISENTCFISKFYVDKDFRKTNIGKVIFQNHENFILDYHPEIKYFRLNALNFNHSYKLVNYYSNFGYKQDLNHLFDINIGEIIPMIKIIK